MGYLHQSAADKIYIHMSHGCSASTQETVTFRPNNTMQNRIAKTITHYIIIKERDFYFNNILFQDLKVSRVSVFLPTIICNNNNNKLIIKYNC